MARGATLMILTDLRIARIMLSSITEATRKLTGTLSPSRLRKKGKALSRSVWSLNCLGGIRHVIGQFE